MAGRHTKKSPAPLIIKEIQTKTTLVRMAFITRGERKLLERNRGKGARTLVEMQMTKPVLKILQPER